MATPQQQRRNPNASFRPALRFPTDPHNPGVLPSRIRHIVEGSSSPNGAGPSSTPPPPSTAVNLLQSRRKPWELDLTKLEDVIRTGEVQRKVILVLGDVAQSSIEPVVTSSLLRNSLVVIVTPFEANLSIPSNKCIPTVRILRLRPRAKPQRQQSNSKKKAGKAAMPSTTGNGGGGPAEPLTAFRLTTIIEWAERVANAWKSQPVRSQAMFAVLNEGEGPANGVGDDGLDTARSKRLNRSNTSLGSDVESLSGSFVGESSTMVMPGRQRVVHPSKSSSTLQSIPDVGDDEVSHQRAHTSLGHGYGNADRRRPSMDGPYNSANGATANKTPLIRKRTSFFGRLKLSSSSPPPMPSFSAPTSPRSPTNFISSAALSFSMGSHTPKSPSSSQPSFDAIINFLPSTSATGSVGTLHTNQGQIATQHAASAHAKLLLRQTILITTISQRFLVPVPPRPTVMSLSAMRSDEDVSGEKGRFTRGDGHWKMRTMNMGGRNVAVASQSLVDVGSGVTSGSAARQRRMSRRFSTTIGSIFNGGNGGPTSPATAPPTPPISRPSSEEDDHSAVASRRGSNSSSSPYRSKSKRSVPKLVHVLPFANAQTSLPPPHLMNNTSANVSAGTARLVRSLEAFLLSWSFGGGSGGNNSRHAGVESMSGSEDDFGSSTGSEGGGVIKGNVRPFLLGGPSLFSRVDVDTRIGRRESIPLARTGVDRV
ncbi:hypothetical protein FRB94_014024 [Tulasnella sp. JGI-2019a]|nr:hypothetical protein FRB94_014024 [Tulasnella sp. JGI-2019a]